MRDRPAELASAQQAGCDPMAAEVDDHPPGLLHPGDRVLLVLRRARSEVALTPSVISPNAKSTVPAAPSIAAGLGGPRLQLAPLSASCERLSFYGTDELPLSEPRASTLPRW